MKKLKKKDKKELKQMSKSTIDSSNFVIGPPKLQTSKTISQSSKSNPTTKSSPIKKSTSKNPKFVRNKPNSNVDESITIKNPKTTQGNEIDPLLSTQNNSKNNENKIEIKNNNKKNSKRAPKIISKKLKKKIQFKVQLQMI